jgi:hypothetical protein
LVRAIYEYTDFVDDLENELRRSEQKTRWLVRVIAGHPVAIGSG